MTKIYTLALAYSLSASIASSQGIYAPAAGQEGSTAIHKDSSIIKSWATGIEVTRGLINISDPTAVYNDLNTASFGVPGLALGKSQESSFDAVSLGDRGTAVLTFDRPVSNGSGPDFAIFENSFSHTSLELAFVEVSSDGKRFVRFPPVSLTQVNTQLGNASALNPTQINNLAGKYKSAYGTPFDLEDIKDSTGIDLNNIRFIKIIDVVGSIQDQYASFDSKGNKINDPWPTPYHSSGFDLEAVGIVNAGQEYKISIIDEFSLSKDSFWNGSDKSGGFTSGLAVFKNSFNPDWGSWSGFTYSNMRNDSTAGYINQYSAITKGGLNAPDSGGTNYVVAYCSSFSENYISFKDNESYVVSGMYITNSTYAYLSMKYGDDFTKKFGGETGNDPDFFKLHFWGEREDRTLTDTIDLYLADFRFQDNTKDFLLNSWKWIDLMKLGKIKKLYFSMSSSDNGNWGMNTPAYFCIDNLTVLPKDSALIFSSLQDISAKKNSEKKYIKLTSAFTAYDTNQLHFEVESNSNSALVQVNIEGDVLELSFTENSTGNAKINISAILGNQKIYDDFIINVTENTDVQNIQMNNIILYPNPFISEINISNALESIITITDLAGHIVFEKRIRNNNETINGEFLSPGLYLLKVRKSDNVDIFKILKK